MLASRFTVPAKQNELPQVERRRSDLEDGQEGPRNGDKRKIVGFQANFIEQHQEIYGQADLNNSRCQASVLYAKQIKGATENQIDAAGHPPECIFMTDSNRVGFDHGMKEMEDTESMCTPGKAYSTGHDYVDLFQHCE